MPRVPRLNSRVNESGLPNVRLNPGIADREAFGGGQSAQAVTQATQGLSREVQQFALLDRDWET